MDGESSRLISLKCLKSITNNFSDEQEIGKGSFGKVYKVRSNPTFSMLCMSIKNLSRYSRPY